MRPFARLLLALSILLTPSLAGADQLLLTGVGTNLTGVTPATLADGVGLWIPPYATVTTGIGVKGGFTNSTQWTLIYSITQAGAAQTNKTSAGLAYSTDPNTKAECTAGTAPGILLDFYDGGVNGLAANFNGISGLPGTPPPLGCGQFPGAVGSRNIASTPTLYVISANGTTQNSAFFRNDTDIGTNSVGGTGAVGKTYFDAGIVPDFNADGVTTRSCTGCGVFLGNIPNTGIGVGAHAMNFMMLLEGRSLVCTGAGTINVTGWGTGTCAGADTIPPEYIAKIVDPTSKYLKEPGAACANFDSDGTKTVYCMRTRRGSLTTNEGTATAPLSAIYAAHTGYVDPGHSGPYEGCVGAGGPSLIASSYCWGEPQVADVQTINGVTGATSGSATIDNNLSPQAIGDAQVIVLSARTVSAGSPTGVTWACPDGTWTLQQAPIDAEGWMRLALCTRIVANSTQAAEGSWTATFSGSSKVINLVQTGFIGYKNVASIGTAVCTASSAGAGTNSYTAPTVTTTQANQLVATFWTRDQTQVSWVPGGPGAARVRMRAAPTVSGNILIAGVDHIETAAGTSTAETASSSYTDGWTACTLPLVHP